MHNDAAYWEFQAEKIESNRINFTKKTADVVPLI
jgi:hypothetical protein